MPLLIRSPTFTSHTLSPGQSSDSASVGWSGVSGSSFGSISGSVISGLPTGISNGIILPNGYTIYAITQSNNTSSGTDYTTTVSLASPTNISPNGDVKGAISAISVGSGTYRIYGNNINFNFGAWYIPTSQAQADLTTAFNAAFTVAIQIEV